MVLIPWHFDECCDGIYFKVTWRSQTQYYIQVSNQKKNHVILYLHCLSQSTVLFVGGFVPIGRKSSDMSYTSFDLVLSRCNYRYIELNFASCWRLLISFLYPTLHKDFIYLLKYLFNYFVKLQFISVLLDSVEEFFSRESYFFAT